MRGLTSFIPKYFLIAFIVAGLLYFAWHLGRKYERDNDPDITFAECTPTQDPEKFDCLLYEVQPELAALWKAIMAEISSPTTKEQLKKDYQAFTEKRTGL